METMTFTGELTIVTCWCGIVYALPSDLRSHQLREHDAGRSHAIFCPLGHESIPSGESRAAKLERQLAAVRASHDQTQADLRETRNKLNAEKAVKSRLKNRIAKGKCPCCDGTFANLRRHMTRLHPEFVEPEDKEASRG
jgi:hypothetical protein